MLVMLHRLERVELESREDAASRRKDEHKPPRPFTYGSLMGGVSWPRT